MERNTDISSVSELEKKLHSARRSLITLNDNIRRFVGKGNKEFRTEKYTPDTECRRNDQNQDKNNQRNDSSKQKRRVYEGKMVFNRLSDRDELWLPTPRLNSRVIRELPSREEILEAQGIDSESKARNRRIFGSLLGTLQKFCQEESRLKKNEDKKARIEKKLETQEQEERALLKKKRNSLFVDRKRKQLEIRCIEKKMARLKDFKIWQTSIMLQKNQIRTITKPHLFFQPRKHTSQTEAMLWKSKYELDCLMKQRNEDLQAELIKMELSNNIDDDCLLEDSFFYECNTYNLHMENDVSDLCANNAKEEFKKAPNKDISMISSKLVIQEA